MYVPMIKPTAVFCFMCCREDGSSVVILLVADPQIQGYQFESALLGPYSRWDADK